MSKLCIWKPWCLERVLLQRSGSSEESLDGNYSRAWPTHSVHRLWGGFLTCTLLCWTTFSCPSPFHSLSLLFICQWRGPAEQLFEKLLSSLSYTVCVICANGYLSSLWCQQLPGMRHAEPYGHSAFPVTVRPVLCPPCVCVHALPHLSPICWIHFEWECHPIHLHRLVLCPLI